MVSLKELVVRGGGSFKIWYWVAVKEGREPLLLAQLPVNST